MHDESSRRRGEPPGPPPTSRAWSSRSSTTRSSRLDGSGTIESWNAGAERLKGYTAAEAIGRSFSMFYTEEDRHTGLPLRLLEEARLKGRVENIGWRLRKDGTRFWGDVVITALHDDDGASSASARSPATSPRSTSSSSRCAAARSGSGCW